MFSRQIVFFCLARFAVASHRYPNDFGRHGSVDGGEHLAARNGGSGEMAQP